MKNLMYFFIVFILLSGAALNFKFQFISGETWKGFRDVLFRRGVLFTEQNPFEVGEVDVNKQQQIFVKLCNVGYGPLHIIDVVSSCGCIKTRWPKEGIKVGICDSINTTITPILEPREFIQYLDVHYNEREMERIYIRAMGVSPEADDITGR